MMAKSHAALGVAGWVVAAPLLHLQPLHPLGLALALAGSLLPDIDHPKSWVGQRVRPISTLVSGVFGHRGITHSALAVAALVALLAQSGYSRSITAALAVGYLSHLAADMLTPRGLRLAWPLRGTWSLPLCRTGSPAEAGIVMALCILAGCMWMQDGKTGAPLRAAQTWAAQTWLASGWCAPLLCRRSAQMKDRRKAPTPGTAVKRMAGPEGGPARIRA